MSASHSQSKTPSANSLQRSSGDPHGAPTGGEGDVGAQPVAEYCLEVARRARAVTADLACLSTDAKNRWLREVGKQLREQTRALQEANERDLAAAPEFQLSDAQIDRLRLTPERIEGMAKAVEEIADLPDPVGEVLETSTRPDGLQVSRVRVPLGVVFFIYESRPNVTVDAAAICVKSGNSVILRGGKEAAHSSRALVELLRAAAESCGVPTDAIQSVQIADRRAVRHFLELEQLIDVSIPRGGPQLIQHVTQHARMPVLKHDAGNCHVYIDRDADLEMAKRIVIDAKCQRPGVCNACESLLVHEAVASQLLPRLLSELIEAGVEVRGDSHGPALPRCSQSDLTC